VGSPVMAVVALLIRLDSPGRLFTRPSARGQRAPLPLLQVSLHGDQCRAPQGRVTRTEPETRADFFKIDNDPRITPHRPDIRRYSLDELPQLWNGAAREMSLVGPRPHPVDEVNHYELQHYRRLDVRPGITGLWQITARGCPSFELNMHLDLTYIETWICGWTCSSWPARFACCSRRKEPDFGHEQQRS